MKYNLLEYKQVHHHEAFVTIEKVPTFYDYVLLTIFCFTWPKKEKERFYYSDTQKLYELETGIKVSGFKYNDIVYVIDNYLKALRQKKEQEEVKKKIEELKKMC